MGLALTASAADAPDTRTLAIPYEEYDLDNGLHVILSEDHSVPFVQVNLWYRVGAKDEVEGRSGFAHLFEHLMFQGSEHMDGEYFGPLQRIGARINGTTNMDRTNYFEGVPSEQLPLALWLGADRMGFLLPALTQEKLDNQKLVVRNERRQSYENRPYGMTWWWLFENLYPEGHPYHIPTIGKHEDIDAANLEDVKDFFKQWYVPNNASLSIAGDFDPAEAKALVEKYFGDIPRGPQPEPILSVEPVVLSGENVIRKTDDVPHNKVWLAWHSPALYAPGDAELDTLSSILTSGKDSRLYRALVEEQQIAQTVSAYQVSMLLGSFYVIEATAVEGQDPDALVNAIDELVAKVKTEGVTEEEVALAKTNWEASFYRRMRTISSKANQLNQYHVQTGDTDYIGKDLARFMDVSTAGVAKALQGLDSGRVVLPSDLRRPQKERKSDARYHHTDVVWPHAGLCVQDWPGCLRHLVACSTPEPLAPRAFQLPEAQTATLSNGVEVSVVENHEMPLVNVQVAFDQGGWTDDADAVGLASVTLDMLNEGAGDYDAAGISKAAKAIAATSAVARAPTPPACPSMCWRSTSSRPSTFSRQSSWPRLLSRTTGI